MSERMDGWRECADPVELAAAVAAGVEVQRNWGYDWQPGTNNETAEQFAGCTKANCRYRVPSSWSWSPEPPTDVPTGAERYLAERLADPEYRAAYEAAAPAAADDLRERRVWTCKIGGRVGRLPDGADAPMRRAVADAFTAQTGCPVEFCFSGWGDDLDESELAVVENREPDPEVIRAALVKRLTTLPGGSPTPSPVPPWPGAVLSGLCDEDGQPTWLAQAGQVRGEQVRRRSDLVWVNNDQMVAFPDTVWVEVRAPRAVPVPETERVPWWEAVGRRWPDGRTVWKVTHSVEGVIAWDNGGEALDVMFSADGTVEVLKDGDR